MVIYKNFYKIFLLLATFSFFSCANEKNIEVYTFPEFQVKAGTTRSFDLGNYLSFQNLDLRFQNENNHELVGNILTINGVGKEESFELIKILAGKEKIDLVVRYLPMVKHKFVLESSSSSSVFVMGSFNDWSRNSLKMVEVNNGFFEIEIQLEPQKYEYKFVVDGNEVLDPINENVVSNNIGGYNSLIDLTNKNTSLSSQLLKKNKTKDLLFFEYIENNEVAIPRAIIALFDNNLLPDSLMTVSDEKELVVNISNFNDGILRVYVQDHEGNYTHENRTVVSSGIPLNAVQDSWYFKIIYNTLVDRFFDGNKQNNRKILDPKLHKLANFQGGDIQGINKKLNEGYFSDLGINAIWVSPIQAQPDSSYVEYIKPNRSFSGYHGYWPIEPRKIDERFGTEEDLHNLVDIAHSKNIKVVLDFVSNHVHQDHIYFQDHEDWFGDFYLSDGNPNIRLWDGETMLTTWFDEFLPSFDFSNNIEAINQVTEDAIWWVKKYNIDGFRQDAVKHVPHSFWKKLTKNIKNEFPNKDFYQIGETFGSDELIGSYVNPSELNAQFNFGIYFNVRSLFSSSKTDFKGVENIIYKNSSSFGPIHLMGNITSSHDQLRFMSYADGQISFDEDGIARAFDNPVKKTRNLSTYSKLANFHAFNSSQPGVPIIYYGEEIGMIGEQDPGNRRLMRFNLDKNEKELFNHFKSINQARLSYPSLAIGDQTILKSKGPIFITLKSYFDERIILVINNGPKTQDESIDLFRGCNTASNIIEEEVIDCFDKTFSFSIEPYSYKFYELE